MCLYFCGVNGLGAIIVAEITGKAQFRIENQLRAILTQKKILKCQINIIA